jgi:conjugal transfer pilus assembly protein TraE
MHIDKLLADVQAKTGVTKFMQILMVGLVLGNIVQGLNYMMIDKSVRVQLVPPEITKSFWVDGAHLSPEYIEQMGEYIVMKYASVTPSTVEFNNALILRHVHPSTHGELSIRFKTSAAKLKADSISRFFFPKEVRISQNGQAAAFIGMMETWIGDKKVPQAEIKAYLVGFEYAAGSVTIKELRETSERDPFAPLANKPGDSAN